MRVAISLLLIISSVFASWVESEAQTRTRQDRYKVRQQRIKSMSTFVYPYVNGNKVQRGHLIEQVIYNERGENEIFKKFNTDGSISYLHKYEYDPRTHELMKERILHADETLHSEIVYKYDEKRNIIEERETDSTGSLIRVTTFDYDKDKHPVEKVEKDGSGNMRERWSYTYENGRIKEIKMFTPDGTMFMRRTYDYNARKQLKMMYTFKDDGSVFSYIEYWYDMKGNKMKSMRYNGHEEPIQELVYKYIFFDGRNN